MNLLEPLPTAVWIGANLYPIQSDFRTAIQFEQLMLDPELEKEEKLLGGLNLFFPGGLPNESIELIFNAVMWFFTGGKERKEKEKEKEETKEEEKEEEEEEEEQLPPEAVYSYEHDAEYIYAAFLTQYGVDLMDTEYLHWWKFQAMFKGLEPTNTFCKIMGYRAAKFTSKMSSAEREHLRKMKKLYALPISEKEQAEQDELVDILKNGGNLSAFLRGDGDE